MAVQVVVWLLAVVVQVTVEQGSPLAPVVVVVAHRASRLATWYARTCWHLAGEESTRWCVVRAGSPAKPYEVVLKLDAKRPSDACLTLGGRPVEFHLARHSAGRPVRLHRQRASWPEGVTVGSLDAGEWVACMARPPSHATRQRRGRTRARVVSMARGARRETCGWWSASRRGGSGGRRAAAAAAARRRQMEGGRWRPHLVVWEACAAAARRVRGTGHP